MEPLYNDANFKRVKRQLIAHIDAILNNQKNSTYGYDHFFSLSISHDNKLNIKQEAKLQKIIEIINSIHKSNFYINWINFKDEYLTFNFSVYRINSV